MIQFAPAAILIVSGTTNIFTSYKPSSIISSLIHFHIRRTFGISLNNERLLYTAAYETIDRVVRFIWNKTKLLEILFKKSRMLVSQIA